MKITSLKRINMISWITLAAVILISVPLQFGIFPVKADWDGSASSSFNSGSGTSSNPYVIKSEKNMGYFIKQLNAGITFEGKYISLKADLDMTGNTWEYASGIKFSGTFTGNAHTIKTDCTLFPDISSTGSITGLAVEAKETVDRAIMCNYNAGLIQMCMVRGDVFHEANSAYASMICENNSGTVLYCGAVGSAIADGSGSDADAWAAMVARNSGTVQGCFASLTVNAIETSKYNMEYDDPIANRNTGSSHVVEENYYNSSLYRGTVTTGKGLTTEEMKSDAFLTILSAHAIPGYQWIAGSDGYPTIDTCGTATVSITGVEGDTTVFHTASISCHPEKSISEGTIYYTTDGSDPRSSTTRKSFYSPNSGAMTIRQDTVVSMTVYYNSQYGPVTRHTYIKLLGSGTETNPYQITTKLQLDAVRYEPDKCYILCNDLVYNESDFALGSSTAGGWESIPIFRGTFDGNSFAIYGLQSSTGGLVDNNRGTITSLRVVDHKLYGHGSCGAIANANYGTVTKCYAKSAFNSTNVPPVEARSVAADTFMGGLVGYNLYGDVSYSRVDGMVIANSAWNYGHLYVGGIVGYGSANSCISNALVASYTNEIPDYVKAGGIAGGHSPSLSNCLSRVQFDLQTATCYQTYIGGITGDGYSSHTKYSLAHNFTVTGNPSTGASLIMYKFAESYDYCYEVEDSRLPDDCPDLDFTEKWMLSDEGIIPQGVMDADGHCWSFSSWTTEPTRRTSGVVVLKCDLCGKTESRVVNDYTHADIPTITAQPESAIYTEEEAANALSVAASINKGTLTYQWYENSANSNEGGTAIEGATSASYTPSTAVVGTKYYYVVVTNTDDEATGEKSASATSDAATITVNARTYQISGQITSYNPKNEIRIDLLQDDVIVYTRIIAAEDGNGQTTQAFEIEDVAAGTYDMVITKSGHLSYTIRDIAVENGDVDLSEDETKAYSNIKMIGGDVNSDGCVDLQDVIMLTSSNTYAKDYDTALNKSADINGDGCFDIQDVIIITSSANYGKSEIVVDFG